MSLSKPILQPTTRPRNRYRRIVAPIALGRVPLIEWRPAGVGRGWCRRSRIRIPYKRSRRKLVVGPWVEEPLGGLQFAVGPGQVRPPLLHGAPLGLFVHDRGLPSSMKRGPEYRGLILSLLVVLCRDYLTPTTSLIFSVRGFFPCSLLRSCSSCRWRASSSISRFSVIQRASLSRSRSLRE